MVGKYRNSKKLFQMLVIKIKFAFKVEYSRALCEFGSNVVHSLEFQGIYQWSALKREMSAFVRIWNSRETPRLHVYKRNCHCVIGNKTDFNDLSPPITVRSVEHVSIETVRRWAKRVHAKTITWRRTLYLGCALRINNSRGHLTIVNDYGQQKDVCFTSAIDVLVLENVAAFDDSFSHQLCFHLIV